VNFIKRLFTTTPVATKTGIVFIVEDNNAYAQSLSAFIKSDFPQTKEVTVFPVGETCIAELDRKPDVIIIDYFLDSVYKDAKTGLDIIKQIRSTHPEMNIIVLSIQKDMEVVTESLLAYQCSYINKDEKAFGLVASLLKEIL